MEGGRLYAAVGRAFSRPIALKPQFDELASVDVRLSTLALRGPEQNRAVWERQMHELNERKETLERQLSQVSAGSANWKR